MRQTIVYLVLIFSFFIYGKALSQIFGNIIDMGQIESDEISEASGIAASTKNPGVFWTHNDSGGKSTIFAFDSLGNHLGNYIVAMAPNRDWEDIAIGPGPIEGEHYIYIGDIGDNSVTYDSKYIFRVREPHVSVGQVPLDTVLYDRETLVFQYPDGNRNAETLMIDPLSLDIYIVSKEDNTKVYRASWPYTFYAEPTFNVDILEVVADLSFSKALAGDISADGKEILVKRSTQMYYWTRNDGQTIGEAMAENPQQVPYVKEPQGEAVCWAGDLSGYFTISEGLHPHLYFYPRLVSTALSEVEKHPSAFKLDQNYPNPFNPATTIRYQLHKSNKVELSIYNLSGQQITTLVNQEQVTGNYQVQWDGKNNKGLKVSSGVYIYRLKSGLFISAKKMLLLQ